MPREVQLQRVRNVIEKELTSCQKETLLAHYLDNLTVSQIAKQQGVNKSTVSRTLKRAERKLREYLKY